ncbi:MAG TPA: hypothetical protein VGM39_16950 [Kofleriaceae bacterium]
MKSMTEQDVRVLLSKTQRVVDVIRPRSMSRERAERELLRMKPAR